MKWFKIEEEKFEAVATVILRVPGYFILDYWSQNDIFNCIPRSCAWSDIVSSGFAIYAVIQGLLLLLLPFEQLVSFYMHYLTVAVLAAADTFSRYYIEAEKELVQQFPDYGTVSFQGYSDMLMLQKSLFDVHNDTESLFLRQQVSAMVFHTLVATLVTFFLDLDCNKDKIVLLVYLVPVFARLAGCPVNDLQITHNFASCFVIFLTVQYIFLCLPHVFSFLKNVYLNFAILANWYGPIGVVVKLWSKLFVPMQLLIFWLLLFVTQVYCHILPLDGKKGDFRSHDFNDSKIALEVSISDMKILMSNIDEGFTAQISEKGGNSAQLLGDSWYFVLLQCAAEVCYTPLMLFGACVTVSYVSKWILVLTKCFASGKFSTNIPETITNAGWGESLVMGLLAVQTSLLMKPMPERLAILCIILLIVVSSLIQSMFECVEPVVLSINTQGVASLSKHIRVWCVCAVLLILPLYIVYMFTMIFDKDFWLLIVMATGLMTSVQVLGLIAMYILLTIDSRFSEPWPALDDLMYYTRGTTQIFEFIVAVFVVGAGVKETISGEWSWISAIVLFVHCYFNVWERWQQGWKSFLLRLDAVKRVTSLPLATKTQLQNFNDVCSICYSEMTSARVTKCHHIFHETCLRKWLYIQDKCPMCHQTISIQEEKDVKNSGIESELGNNIPFVDT